MLILINIHYPGPNFLLIFLKKSHSKHLYGGVENSFGYYLLTGLAVYLSPKLLRKTSQLMVPLPSHESQVFNIR